MRSRPLQIAAVLVVTLTVFAANAAGLSTLQDNFNDGVINTGLWTKAWVVGGTITESSGTLNLSANASTDGVGLILDSVSLYTLTGSHAFVEVPEVVSQLGYIDQQFRLRLDSNNRLTFHSQNGRLKGYAYVGGVRTTTFDVVYSATAHRWWRFRESSRTVYWETSSDGTTWTVRGSMATSSLFALSSLRVQLYVETYSGGTASPGVARFDNFNLDAASCPVVAVDPCDVQQLYATKVCGETWAFDSVDPLNDPRFDAQAPITKNTDGSNSWNITDTSVRLRVETSVPFDPASIATLDRDDLTTQGYMQSTQDWRNVEMTGFVRINDNPNDPDDTDLTENLSWFVRTARHNDSVPCEGSAYHGNLQYEGGTDWSKESWHVSYDDLTDLSGTSPIYNRFVGLKTVVRNMTYNGQPAVKLELWVKDPVETAAWTKKYEFIDSGTWGGETPATAAAPTTSCPFGGVVPSPSSVGTGRRVPTSSA